MEPQLIPSRPRVNIENSIPTKWELVVGNKELVDHYKDIVYGIRIEGNRRGMNTLTIGPSRGGKTATTKLFARSLLCEALDTDTLNPCGECDNCRADAARYGLRGLEVEIQGSNVHYLPIDCPNITDAELADKLIELRDYDGVRVVWLDEAHRLCRRGMDERLLKPVEEHNFMWILSTAEPERLEKMLRNRFITVATQPPTIHELTRWLADRCKDGDIPWDDGKTLIRLAERAKLVPGLALQVLAAVQKSRPHRRVLTRDRVEEFIFNHG